MIRIANERNRFTRFNGIMLTELGDDYAVLEHEITPDSLNLLGVVHGGLIATMMDFACGAAARSDGQTHVTASMEIKYISNVSSGKLIARSEMISRGRKLSNVRVKVTDYDSGKLIAEGMATYYCVGHADPVVE
mgnify:CR=1 FL=1